MLTSPVVVQVTQEAAEGNDGSMDERRGGCGGAAFRRESRVHDGGRALCRALRHGFRRVVSRHNAATGGGLRCTGRGVCADAAVAGLARTDGHVGGRFRSGLGPPLDSSRRGCTAAARRAPDVGMGLGRWRCVVWRSVRVARQVEPAAAAFRGDDAQGTLGSRTKSESGLFAARCRTALRVSAWNMCR